MSDRSRSRDIGRGLSDIGQGLGVAGVAIAAGLFLSSCVTSEDRYVTERRRIDLEGAKAGLKYEYGGLNRGGRWVEVEAEGEE